MSSWSALHPSILSRVRGAPDPAVDLALRTAAQTFYGRTRAWQEWVGPVTVAGGARGYALPLPADAKAVRLLDATRDGRPFSVLSVNEFPYDLTQQEGDRDGLVSADLVNLQLVRALPDGAVLRLRLALQPSDAAQGLPDALMRQHRQALIDGALSDLLDQAGADWRDPAEAARRDSAFLQAIASETVDVYTGQVGRVPRARVKWC